MKARDSYSSSGSARRETCSQDCCENGVRINSNNVKNRASSQGVAPNNHLSDWLAARTCVRGLQVVAISMSWLLDMCRCVKTAKWLSCQQGVPNRQIGMSECPMRNISYAPLKFNINLKKRLIFERSYLFQGSPFLSHPNICSLTTSISNFGWIKF